MKKYILSSLFAFIGLFLTVTAFAQTTPGIVAFPTATGTIKVNVNASSGDNSFVVAMTGQTSQTINATSGSVSFSSLTVGNSYTITVTPWTGASGTGTSGTAATTTAVPLTFFTYKGSGNVDVIGSYNGSPANFTANNQAFQITGTVSSWTVSASLIVTGTNSIIVLGDGTTTTSLTVPSGNTLGSITSGTNTTIDILDNATITQTGTLGAYNIFNMDGTGAQKLNAGTYGGEVNFMSGTTTLQGGVTVGSGSSTVGGSIVNNGATLALGTYTYIDKKGLTINSGGILNLGTGFIQPYTGYAFTVSAGANVISGSTNGLDGNINLFNTTTSGWFAASGINYTFSAATNSVVTTTSTSAYTVGSNTTFTVNSATGIVAGQSVYYNGKNIGFVVGVSTNTITASLNTSFAISASLSFGYNKMFCSTVANTTTTSNGGASAGSGVTLTLTSATNVAVGQAIYVAGVCVGVVTAVSSPSITALLSVAIANSATINFRTASSFGTNTTSAQATTGAGQTFTVASSTGVIVGQTIYINGGSTSYGTVTGVTGTTITATLTTGIPNALPISFSYNAPLSIANLTIGANCSLNTPLTITGDLTLTGGTTLTDNGNIVSLAGNIAYTGSGTATHSGTGKISMTGASKTVAGVTLGNLEIAAGVGNTISTSAAVTAIGALTLTSGKLNIGANNLTTGSIANGSSSNYIYGTGLITINSVPSAATLFPIGTSSSVYTPVTLTSTTSTPNVTIGVGTSYANTINNSSSTAGLQWTILSSATSTAQLAFGYNTTISSAKLGIYTTKYDESTAGSVTGSNPYTFTTTSTTMPLATSTYYYGIGVANSFVPTAPTIGAASSSASGHATIAFTNSVSNTSGSYSYTVTSNPSVALTQDVTTSSPITVSGLTDGTSYTFTVTATNTASGSGSSTVSAASSASNSVTPGVVPSGAPTGVSATASGAASGSLIVSFTAPVFTGNGGATITSYTVTSSPGNFTATGSSSPITVTGLTNGVSYTFTVTATNSDNATSVASAASTGVSHPLTAPDAPTGVSATISGAGSGQAIISFTPPANNGGSSITAYSVTSSPSASISQSSTTSSPITVSGLTNGTAYTFTVTATNSTGTSSASSASGSVTPATTPSAPSITSAVSGTGQATISFTAPSSNGSAITAYTITSSPSVALTQSSTTTSPITVTGLNNGTAYTFTITATNGVGTGSGSTTASLTPGSFKYNSGNVDVLTSWVSTDNSGGNPANFTANGQAFTITGVTNVNSWTSNATWTVSGTGSAITVGDGTNAATLSIPAGNSIAGTVNVQLGSTLKVESNTNPPFTAGIFTSNATYGAAIVYDGSGTQYLPLGIYTGGVTVSGLSVSGTANTVVINGNITVGGGASGSPATALLNILSGNTLSLNGYNAKISRSSTIPSGATVNFGNSGTLQPTGYGITFASGSNVITSNTYGLDGSINYSLSTVPVNSFSSGVNYTFNTATSTPFSTLAASTTTTSTSGTGSTSFTVTSATGIAIGQSIYLTNGQTSIGTVTGTSGTTINANISGSALGNGVYVNFRNNATSTTVANVTAGTVTLGAAITANANITATSISLSNNNLTLGGFNATANTIINGTGFVIANSTGTLTLKSVSASATTFPIGSTASDYNPITLTGTTGSPNITVGVKSSFTNSLAAGASNYVGLQWSVLSSVASNSTITFQYNNSDVTGVLASPILGTYTTSYTETALGTIGGSNPYTIAQSAAAALGNGSAYLYGIGNVGTFVSASRPDAPTIGTAIVNGTGSATVSFTAPNDNGSAIVGYTATSNPGSVQGSISQAGSGTITINGLTNGVSYTFTVTATNGSGTSTASSASNAITTGIFSYSGSGNVDVLTSWVDAASVHPSNFTAAGQIFNITGAGTVNSWTSNATWTVSGAGSKVVVGDGSATVTGFKIPVGNTLAGTIDVQTSDTLYVESNANPPFIPGTFYSNSTVSSGLVYDGSGIQYLNGGLSAGAAQVYPGILAIRGTNNTLSLNGHIIVGGGSSGSPTTAGISMISGTTLVLNTYSMRVNRGSVIPNGATVNFGTTGTIVPYYSLAFQSGSNVITGNANGLDASINYYISNAIASYFASGVNYTFNTATSTPFSTLAASTTTTSTSGTGSTSFTVTTATNIATGQLIYLTSGTSSIGTVTGVSGTTVSANITGAALTSGVYVNFRNTATNSPTVTAGNVTLGAAITTNASLTVNTLLALSNYNLTLGGFNITTLGTAASLTRGTGYIIINSTGKVTRIAVPATATTFPIGTASYYLPLVLTNTTNARNITVGVGTTFTNTPINSSNIVNAQWSVLASAAATSTITFQYNGANVTGTLSNPILGTYTSAYAESLLNSVAGSDPFTVTTAAAVNLSTSTANFYGIGNLNSFSSGTPGYYYYSSGNVDDLTSWGTNIDGTGSNPIDFTSNGQVFNITKTASVNSWSNTSAVWTVSGTGSKIVVGSGSSATILQIPTGNSITGTVDVQTGATLQVESNAATPFTAGTFSANSSIGAALIYDGIGTQYLPAGDYYGGLSINGTNNTVVLNGDVWIGHGGSSATIDTLKLTSGTTLELNGHNAIVQRSSTIASGSTVNFGTTGTLQPYMGYNLTFASGSNVITANANGLDASLNYANKTGSFNCFANGVNYTFNTSTTKPFSTLVNATQTVGGTSVGATSIVVTSATNIAGGQSIYAANGTTAIGTVVSVSGTTITTSALTAALANSAYVNFRNPSLAVTTGTVTLGANVTTNANVTVNGLLDISASILTVGANTLSLGNNTVPSFTSGAINAAGSSAIIAFTNATGISIPTGLFTGNINNLTINGAGGITLTTPITITGTLTLTNGKIILGTNNLTLANTATIVGGTNASYINASSTGLFLQNSAASTQVLFPIGTSTSFAPITVTTASNSVLSTNITSSLSHAPGDPTQVALLQWSVTGSVATTATIKYQFNSADLPSGFVTTDPCEVGTYTNAYSVTSEGTPNGSGPFTVTASGLSIPTSGTNYYVVGNTGNIVVTTTTWLGTISTDWATAGNWNNGVPSATIDATIATATKNPIIATAKSVKNFTVASGMTVTNNGGLTIKSSFSNNGTITGTGTTTLAGSSAQTISGKGVVANLTLNNVNGATLSDSLGVTGVLTLQSGQFSTNGKLTLKSLSISNSGILAPYGVNGNTGTISGTVTVERFIPKGFRAYRDMAPQVYGAGSIFSNWQDNGSVTSPTGIFITGASAADVNSSVFGNGTASSPNPTPNGNGLDYSLNGINSASIYSNSSSNGYIGFGSSPDYTESAITNTITTNLDAFRGYRVLIRGARDFNLYLTGVPLSNVPGSLNMIDATTLRAKGTLVTGDVTYSTSGVSAMGNSSASTNGLNSSPTGFSMVANPYVAPVVWSDVYTASGGAGTSGLNASYWYLDPTSSSTGGYFADNALSGPSVVNNQGGGTTEYGTNAPSGILQAGQAFFVQNDGTGTTSTSRILKFTESCKDAANSRLGVFGISTPLSKIYLSLLKNNAGVYTLNDGAAAAFSTKFKNTYGMQDAKKLSGSSDNLSIADKGMNLSIDGRLPATASDVLPISLSSLSGTDYKLVVNAANYTANGFAPYLVDAYSKTTTAITGIDTIAFKVDTKTTATYQNRFSIVFKPTTLAINSIVATATANGNVATISWNTVGEKGVAKFEVEKSTDGSSFASIGQLAAKNTATACYTAIDKDVDSAISYYRIKAISTDGTIAYSNIAKVTYNVQLTTYNLFPNPLTGKTLNVQLGNVVAGKYVISIYNSLGQKVTEQAINHAGGNGTHAISIASSMAKGVYNVVISSTESKQTVYQTSLSVQ